MKTKQDKKLYKEVPCEVVLRPLQAEFLQDRLNDLDLIKEKLDSDQIEAVCEITHKWKGFSKPYGFSHLGELALRVEAEIASKNDLAEVVKEIENYLGYKRNQAESGDLQ